MEPTEKLKSNYTFENSMKNRFIRKTDLFAAMSSSGGTFGQIVQMWEYF